MNVERFQLMKLQKIQMHTNKILNCQPESSDEVIESEGSNIRHEESTFVGPIVLAGLRVTYVLAVLKKNNNHNKFFFVFMSYSLKVLMVVRILLIK